MTTDVDRRLQQLKRPDWTIDEIREFYGYDSDALELVDLDVSGNIDRFEVERTLRSDKGLLSPRLAAAELGVEVETVKGLARVFETGTPYATAFPTRATNGSFLVDKRALGEWVRSVTDYRGVWYSIPDRTERLLEAVADIYEANDIDEPTDVLEDVVFDQYTEVVEEMEGSDDVPPVASTWCAITDDPVSHAHSEHLAIAGARKPAALPPDRVGWHALYEHPELRSHTLGSKQQFQTFEALCDDRGL